MCFYNAMDVAFTQVYLWWSHIVPGLESRAAETKTGIKCVNVYFSKLFIAFHAGSVKP